MTIQEQPEIREAWNAIAAGYDTFVTDTHMSLGSENLKEAGVGVGTRFLDVAAGSGALSIPAARLGAQVLATDISEKMVDRLAARARREGLASLEVGVMDGQALDLDDDSFDVAGSQFGVMLFPDLPRALSELARVTRPGGTVLLIVFGPPAQVEFLTFFLAAMHSVVPDFEGLPTDPPPLPFQVSNPERLRSALAAARLSEIRIETLAETIEFSSGRQMWDWVVHSNPIGSMLVADLSGDQCDAVRDSLDDLLRERSRGQGAAVLTNEVHVAVGTV